MYISLINLFMMKQKHTRSGSEKWENRYKFELIRTAL